MTRPLIFLCIFISLALTGCKTSKYKSGEKTNTHKTAIRTDNNVPIVIPDTLSSLEINSSNRKTETYLAKNIIDYALQFRGVPYRYGGTTKKGMDCSGLVYIAYKTCHINLPRISRDMAKEGERIPIDEAQIGDLLFFKTNGKQNSISHVGLVITALPGNVEFIHATTSQGVIISSLAERYWYYSFVEARRML